MSHKKFEQPRHGSLGFLPKNVQVDTVVELKHFQKMIHLNHILLRLLVIKLV